MSVLRRSAVVLGTALCAVGIAQAQPWSDNFDSYATGSQMHGQGGWAGWDNDPGAGALTSAAQALSAPNSVAIAGGSDLVHEYTGANSGVWTFSADMYIPSGRTGTTYFILLNSYEAGNLPADNWSIEIAISASGAAVDDFRPETPRSFNLNAWNQIQVVADLTNNTQTTLINGDVLSTGTWTTSGTSALNIAAVDLFANGSGAVFYDNLSLTPEPTSAVLLVIGGLGLLRRRMPA